MAAMRVAERRARLAVRREREENMIGFRGRVGDRVMRWLRC